MGSTNRGITLAEFIERYGAQKDHHQVSLRRLYERNYKRWALEIEKNAPSEEWLLTLAELGLKIDDAFFIRGYTFSCSSWLNSEKRNGRDHDSDAKKHFAANLAGSLGKLPSYSGTVWRWEEADDELQKFTWFKDHTGLIVSIPYFLSTSLDDVTTDPMLWKIEAIDGGSGRFVGNISTAPSEQEVLFLPDAKFRIIGVADDNRIVFMKEVPPDTSAQMELCGVYYRNFADIDPAMKEEGLFD